MRPFVLYLAATDVERNYGAAAERNRRPRFAPVDAPPLNEPAPVSRRSRLLAILRRSAVEVDEVDAGVGHVALLAVDRDSSGDGCGLRARS